jgi:hypothetical protein
MVTLTDSDKRRLFWSEFCWTLAGATILLMAVWELLHIGGQYVLP